MDINYTDTQEMYYDINHHRYVLTPDAIVERYGIQLSDILDSDGMVSADRLPELFLERVSKELYSYIYLWSEDHDKTEYVLSLPKYRDGIQDAMEEFTYTLLMSNTDPSVYFSGNSLKAVEVPPSVQTLLLQHKIIFRGRYYGLEPDFMKDRGVKY